VAVAVIASLGSHQFWFKQYCWFLVRCW